MGFGVDIFVANGPEMLFQEGDFNTWEVFLEDGDVVDDLAECEVRAEILSGWRREG